MRETHDLLDLMPFASELGIELLKADPTEVVGTLPYSPRLCTAGAILHGGALMTLADTLGAVCAYLNLPSGGRTATTTSATNFLRPVGAGSITGTAIPVHLGRSVIVVRVDVTDANGKLAATTTQTQAVLPGPRSQESRT
jgi:uncharacterized protein (TIGR00369 family)